MEERVFISIPLASAVVEKVCRRSWNLIRLQSALSSTLRIFFCMVFGFLGTSSVTRDVNIHRESVFSLSFLSTVHKKEYARLINLQKQVLILRNIFLQISKYLILIFFDTTP